MTFFALASDETVCAATVEFWLSAGCDIADWHAAKVITEAVRLNVLSMEREFIDLTFARDYLHKVYSPVNGSFTPVKSD
jgi:hypothetical protein